MAKPELSRWQRLQETALALIDDQRAATQDPSQGSELTKLVHFWVLVVRSFIRNRCLVRASALAYTTLLALIPTLAVGVSIALVFLQSQGEKPIRELIDKLVVQVAPTLDLQVKTEGLNGVSGREEVVAKITTFIANISGGALGGTSMLALIFVAIQMLRTIEATFNDIWGVTRGRGWMTSITTYFTVIALGPLTLALALGLTSGPHFTRTLEMANRFPGLTSLLFSILPFFMLSLAFAAFYAFMPNTKVRFSAALMGGLVAGFLWQGNSLLSAMSASKVVTYSQIYGSLALIPLFLLGIYFSWMFLLFGAQVAYAYQNRATYLQERQAEGINQAGREFVALRLAAFVAGRFARSERAATTSEISEALGVPSRLTSLLLGQLTQAGLLVETAGQESAYSPAKPLDQMQVAELLRVLRAGQGVDLATREDAVRLRVRGVLETIRQAETRVAAGITFEQLAALGENNLRT